MKTIKTLLLAIALVAVGNLCADTVDQATSKLVLGSGLPQPSGPPKAIFSHALVDNQNRILFKAWDGTVKISPANAPTGAYSVIANIVQARTVTTDGTTTGTISPGATHVTVTSDSANKILILPAPVVGKQIVIHAGATGFELRSSAPATIAINGGTGTAAESAIAAASTCFLTCVTTTAWKGYFMDADGDVAKIEAAAP